MSTKFETIANDHFHDLIPLFPVDWALDFPRFMELHGKNNYFRGFTLFHSNKIIGFGCLFLYEKTAWLGNIVVDEKYRGNGFGSKITKHLIETGKKLGIETFNLTATLLGKPVYEKLGFIEESNYEFFTSDKPGFNFNITGTIRKMESADIEEVCRLDFLVTGEKRYHLLKHYTHNISLIFNGLGNLSGYSNAGKDINTIISNDIDLGLELVRHRLNSGVSKFVIPELNLVVKDFLLKNGFSKQSQLQKMVLGKKPSWRPNCIFNRGAGYCG